MVASRMLKWVMRVKILPGEEEVDSRLDGWTMFKRTNGRWGLKDGEGKPKIRDLWRRIAQEAKAHDGLYNQVVLVVCVKLHVPIPNRRVLTHIIKLRHGAIERRQMQDFLLKLLLPT
jgi:hypothetical protein